MAINMMIIIRKKYDTVRTKYLESFGIKVLRFWNNEINNNLAGVIDEIVNNLE